MKTPERRLASAVLSLATTLAVATPAVADEGKWMPQQVPALAAQLRGLGFEGDPQAFADLTGQPMGAIVSLGYCTASFVSPDGLMATNHHCVTGPLQYNSTPERNLLVEFRAGWTAQGTEPVTLRLAASTLYRFYVNGQFDGHGPAKAGHGFYRVDE